jgi:hypothetical protein
MYSYIFSLVEGLETDRTSGEPPVDGDNAKIEDTATEIIDENQNPIVESVRRRTRTKHR